MADVSIRNIEGGANRVLYEEATGLAAQGHNISILTRRLPGSLKEEKILNVTEYRYGIDRTGSLSFLVATFKNSRRMFKALVQDASFDIIHCHQPFTAAGVLSCRKSRAIPRIYTCHSLAFEEYETRYPYPEGWLGQAGFALHSKGRKRLERYALNHTQTVAVLSRFMKKKLMANHRVEDSRIRILPGGVDPARFRPDIDKRIVRHKMKLPQDRFILLTVRNLVPRMGLENLVFAMGTVIQEVKDAFLVIGGEGPLRESLEVLIRKRGLNQSVYFPGYISEKDLPNYYQAADLFILPTVSLEGFGLVTLEALASGLPVLGTPIGATPEILEQLDPTLLFKDPSPASISKLIVEKSRTFKREPAEYLNLSERCRSFVEKQYTWEKHLEGLLGMYKDLVEK